MITCYLPWYHQVNPERTWVSGASEHGAGRFQQRIESKRNKKPTCTRERVHQRMGPLSIPMLAFSNKMDPERWRAHDRRSCFLFPDHTRPGQWSDSSVVVSHPDAITDRSNVVCRSWRRPAMGRFGMRLMLLAAREKPDRWIAERWRWCDGCNPNPKFSACRARHQLLISLFP